MSLWDIFIQKLFIKSLIQTVNYFNQLINHLIRQSMQGHFKRFSNFFPFIPRAFLRSLLISLYRFPIANRPLLFASRTHHITFSYKNAEYSILHVSDIKTLHHLFAV